MNSVSVTVRFNDLSFLKNQTKMKRLEDDLRKLVSAEIRHKETVGQYAKFSTKKESDIDFLV